MFAGLRFALLLSSGCSDFTVVTSCDLSATAATIAILCGVFCKFQQRFRCRLWETEGYTTFRFSHTILDSTCFLRSARVGSLRFAVVRRITLCDCLRAFDCCATLIRVLCCKGDVLEAYLSVA